MKTPKIWKVCVIGDADVGKTSLVKRFIYNTFNDEKEETLESKAFKKKMGDVIFMVWDVSIYEQHIDKILNGAKAVIILGDITRGDTYDTMREIARFLNGHRGMKIFVGNKKDLKYQAEFWKEELGALAESYDSPYFFASAKTGENVEEIFRYIAANA
jgi:small GTP-binding protein